MPGLCRTCLGVASSTCRNDIFEAKVLADLLPTGSDTASESSSARDKSDVHEAPGDLDKFQKSFQEINDGESAEDDGSPEMDGCE